MPKEKLITNPSEIRLREQDQVQTILGRPPGWILRWGITVVFFTILTLVLVSYFVKFPDVIPARVVLTTEIPPVHLFAQSEGKIKSLLVEDKENVNVNELLAIIENSSNYEDVIQLENFLMTIKEKSPREIIKQTYPKNLSLGVIQTDYATFTQNINDYTFFENKDELKAKIQTHQSSINYLDEMNESLRRQQSILQKTRAIADTNLLRMEKLSLENAVSLQEVEAAKSQVLVHEREAENLAAEILRNKLNKEKLELEIINLKENRRDGTNQKSNSLKEKIEILLSKIQDWKQQYLIIAPMSGQVSFPTLLNKNQFIKNGQELMTIIPAGGVGQLVGNALLPMDNSGKVEVGMIANIRLNGYPYQEFGVIESKVKSKSSIPQNGTYLLELSLPSELITTYDKPIPFQQEMEGIANIITEDRRILERIFDRVLNLIKNR